MITLEKVLLLKDISLFKYVSEEILLLMAETMREQEVQSGEIIIKKGDLGDTMYIIAEGSVKVHDGDTLLANLNQGEVFGELAALDPEIRTATVTAKNDCSLLTLDTETLYDFVNMHSEFSRGIIIMLCKRAREMTFNPTSKSPRN